MAIRLSIFVFSISLISSASFISNVSKRSITRIYNAELSNQCASETFQLPIFPLRKGVKLPTESLTLNLYEKRYLALSEYVLASSDRVFGGLYCSDKTQMIKNGVGPIVPMVEPGDIGVVCKVVYDAEAMIPTATEPVRRIKLEGFAVGRFQIQRVLQNGYDDTGVEGDHAFPFILAEVSRIDDLIPCRDEIMKSSKLEMKIFDQIKDREGADSDRVTWNLDNNGDEVEAIRASLSPFLFGPGVPQSNQGESLSSYEEAICSWERVESQLDEHKRQQLFSFAMVSLVSANKCAAELLSVLHYQSTYERLLYVEQNLRTGWML